MYNLENNLKILPGEPLLVESTFSNPEKSGWVCPAPFLEFTRERSEYLSYAVRLVLKRNRAPEDWKYDPLAFMREPERSFLHDFLVNLSAFADSVPHKYWMLHPLYILTESIEKGSSFANWLSVFKDYVLIRKTKRLIPEYEQTFSEFICYYGLVDKIPDGQFQVGYVFRHNQLLKWKPPEFDLKEVVNERVVFAPGILKQFRIELRDYLAAFRDSKEYQPVQLYEVVRDTPSMTQEGPVWELDLPEPAMERGMSKTTQVPRDLKECRAASVEKLSSLLRIQWIETAVARLLKRDKRNALVYTVPQLEKMMCRRLSPGKRKEIYTTTGNPTGYCRDFRKEGLTKPRELLKIMLEELHALYPNERAFESVDFFNNWQIYDKYTKPYYAHRGHGLGMANALTTLMQLVLEGLVVKYSGVTPKWSCYQNDDAAVILWNWEQAQRYKFFDMQICRDLGLDFKTKSSFLSVGHVVLCEVYASTRCPDINKKDSFNISSAYNLYKCVNTSHARQMWLAGTYTGLSSYQATEIRRYWGYALYKAESTNMSLFGGWRREALNTIRTDFFGTNCDWKIDRNELAAYRSYEKTRLIIKPWLKERVREAKLKKLLIREFFDMFEVSKISNKTMFRLSEDPEENTRLWRTYESALIRNFRLYSLQTDEVTYGSLYKQIIEKKILLDFVPPYGEEEIDYVNQAFRITGDYQHPCSGFSLKDLYDGWCELPYVCYYLAKTCFGKYHNTLNIITEDVKSTLSYKFQTRAHFVNKDYIIHFEQSPVPPARVFHMFHDPITYYRVMDDLLGNYQVIIPKTVPKEKLDLISTRELFIPNDFRYWIEFSRLTPRERLLFNYFEKKNLSTRGLQYLIEVFHRFKTVSRNLPFSNDGVKVTESLMHEIRMGELQNSPHFIQGDKNLLWKYIEPTRRIWFNGNTDYDPPVMDIEVEEPLTDENPLKDFIASFEPEFTETALNQVTSSDLSRILVLDEIQEPIHVDGFETIDELSDLPHEDVSGYDALFGVTGEDEYIDQADQNDPTDEEIDI